MGIAIRGVFDSRGARIDIYPVGLLRDIRDGRPPTRTLRYVVGQARRRNWRAVRNTFNGYLAEPFDFPPGVRRCGSGWTKRRAMRSWERQLRRAGRERSRT